MKKILPLLAVFLALLLLAFPGGRARADSPYTTWAYGPRGGLVITQDAYSPYTEVDLPINGAEDMFVSPDGSVYIADTGNGQILKLKDWQVIATYGKGTLQSPTGLYVDDQGTMYVADAGKNSVFILDKNGNVMKEFGRPTEPLFGKNRQFLPRKIAVDARQNLYVISEGSVDGVAQFNTQGNFIGYFGANASQMSLVMILQRTFLTKEQLSQFVKNEAPSPSNIAIDDQGMVYTVTAGTSSHQAIRKFTIAGKNIFPDTIGSRTFRDIDVSGDGLVLAVDADGQIYEYDVNGGLLFIFGAKDKGEQRTGTLLNPMAIGRYKDFIYVLDKDKNAVVVYQTTAFAQTVHNGVRLYINGFYDEAKPYFEQVLNHNGSFILSYQAIADAYFKEQNYPAALSAYRLAEDRNGYSQAFWELRNIDLQKYLSPALLGILGLVVVQAGARRLNQRTKWTEPAGHWLRGLTRFKWVDDLVFMFRFIKQPADSFYYIKKDERGSLGFAFLIYAWVVVARVLSLYSTAFIFSPYSSPSQIHVENEVLTVLGLMVLWVAANYLVSTITDGEGRVRDVVIGTAYSLFPYALFALPIALLTNVLTFNEVFLYTFTQDLMYVWVAMMLFIMVQEVHNYSFGETLRNVVVTLFTMGLFLLTGYVLYVLFSQLVDFVSTLIQEIGLRG